MAQSWVTPIEWGKREGRVVAIKERRRRLHVAMDELRVLLGFGPEASDAETAEEAVENIRFLTNRLNEMQAQQLRLQRAAFHNSLRVHAVPEKGKRR